MPELSVSTWSLHHAQGTPVFQSGPAGSGRPLTENNADALNLLDIPSQISKRGIKNLEICHFHFRSLDDGYIRDFRQALADANVHFFSLLIDAGDITHPDPARRDIEIDWIRDWIEIAGRCGASHARVIAGYADIELNGTPAHDHDVIRLSAGTLQTLAKFGQDNGVNIITENFHALTKHATHVNAILDLCDGNVGLCVDYGNFHGPEKYDELAAIMPRANDIHAKANYPEAGTINRDDFLRCMDIAKAANFNGPYTLIFSDPGDEWDGLAEMGEIVKPYLG